MKGNTSLHLTWKHEKREGGLLLAKSPTVISRTISFPLQHPGRGLGKVREEMELKSGGGGKERWLGSGKVAGEGPGRLVRRVLTSWKAAGRGEGQSHIFWKVLVFSKGVFLGILSTRLQGSLLALTPAPSCRASRRELGFPRGPAPPGRRLCQPRRTGLSRLLRKGKARARARPGGEHVCAEGQRGLRLSQTAPCQPLQPRLIARVVEGVPGNWLLRWTADISGCRAASGNPRAAERSLFSHLRRGGWNF